MLDNTLSSKYQIDGAIVSQFKKLRFPVEMRIIWNIICQQPLKIQAVLWGMKVQKGNTSSTMWFPRVSKACQEGGAWCAK